MLRGKQHWTSEDIASQSFTSGFGYQKQPVDQFRRDVADAYSDLEARLANANAELEARQNQAPQPQIDPVDIAKALTDEQLRHAGLMAIGAELVEARMAAHQRRTKAERQIAHIVQDAVIRLQSARSALSDGNQQYCVLDARNALSEAVRRLDPSIDGESEPEPEPEIEFFR